MEEIFIGEAELDHILELLKTTYKTDFTDYARTSLKRRIARIKTIFGLHTYNDVRYFIASDPENLRAFIKEITVHTTEMFRDPEFWKYLREQLLPRLSDYPTIRIWHAGCSSGEEPVSMAILVDELGLLAKTKIYASDISNDILQRSAQACFRIKDFDLAWSNYKASGGQKELKSYFDVTDETFTLQPQYKSVLNFKRHDLVQDDAFTKVDLILCRNVLIYFNANLQARAVRVFSRSLFKGGYLAIGEKENISFLEEVKAYSQKNLPPKIYQYK